MFEDLEREILKTYKDSVSKEIDRWYTKTQLPGFLIKELETYKVLDGEFTKYQIRFKITNPETIDGIVTINIDLDDKNDNRGFGTGEPEPA
ncbi:MAG: hypothetical protein MZV64_70450 [Ignavibacteriales bacterium]|nr:hypothetical protein [Ignavibacteriales bacterium]